MHCPEQKESLHMTEATLQENPTAHQHSTVSISPYMKPELKHEGQWQNLTAQCITCAGIID